ncbi:hypothetical protein BBC27_02310 [Acidithiobacillus ferrivorans]|uniref:Uncharacterized protein n=1 Tax=Acidithiobacillus ferrivorans TaxID=160808 RepID=A0A1B9BVD7_9PROT|nr:hypothetical protein BBC27_02310 [Acidithiobacillus ferrivorans]
MNPHNRVIQTPVDHFTIHKLGIGYQDIHMVVGHDLGVAHAQLFDLAMQAVLFDLDVVANFDTALEEQNESGRKIAENILQPETQTNTYHTTQESQTAEIDTDRLQGNENAQGNNQVIDEPRDGVSRGMLQLPA